MRKARLVLGQWRFGTRWLKQLRLTGWNLASDNATFQLIWTIKSAPVQSIEDVTKYQLCTGCGVCAYIEPERFRMGDAFDYGRRPLPKNNNVKETGDAIKVCPGINLEHRVDLRNPEFIGALADGLGPVLEVCEGFATDDEIRYAGSSGGGGDRDCALLY